MKMSECPACGEKVKTGVAVCRHCGAILDAEKAAKHGLGNKATLQGKVIAETGDAITETAGAK
jgi:transposase